MVVQPNGKIDYMGIMEKMSGRGNGTWTGTSAVDKNGGIKNPYNIKLAKIHFFAWYERCKKMVPACKLR